MKKVLLSLAAVTAIAAAASPAAAAPGNGIDQRQHNLAQRIDRDFHRGHLTRVEANRLVAQLRQVEAMERHYRRGGLSRWERQDINRRLDAVQARLRIERRDNDRQYGYGYGRW